MADIKQTANEAYVTGYLKTIDLKNEIFDGKEVIGGHLVVLVEDKFGKSEVKVNVRQNAKKKDGNDNSLFKALKTIQSTYKSIDAVGIESADYIRVTGELQDNFFFAVDKNEFIENKVIKGTFINRVEPKENPSGCKAIVEGVVTEIKNKDDELYVEIVGIGYNGRATKFDGYILKELIPIFQQNYRIGCTTSLNFAIVNAIEIEEIQKEVGFGEALGEKITRTITKRIIFGGDKPNYNGISKEQIQQALAVRQSEMDKARAKALEKANGGSMATGFVGQQTASFTAPTETGFGMQGGAFSTQGMAFSVK